MVLIKKLKKNETPNDSNLILLDAKRYNKLHKEQTLFNWSENFIAQSSYNVRSWELKSASSKSTNW